jgi:aspartyl-tRNA synthetase
MVDVFKENFKRTHYAGDLEEESIGEEVVLMGWVHRRRDMGNLIFIDLRDVTGIAQIVFNPQNGTQIHAKAHKLRIEFVIGVRGKVMARPDDMINPELKTGKIEIAAFDLKIFSDSAPLPVQVNENILADEDLRLKYRYIDLRRPILKGKILLRHKIVLTIRNFLSENKFYEIETPMLVRSTPEGARDYLVPSREYPGKFFALPQSPQIYKQLLMISGFDRYFQIAHCFRDEDLRADRQPEFTQLDMEMSFVTQEDIFTITQQLFHRLFNELIGVELPIPFPSISYKEAMSRFGTDKPDLRFNLEIKDLSDILKNSNFKIFSSAIQKGGCVRAINAKGAAKFSRKDIEKMEEYAKQLGAKGLAQMKFVDGKLQSNIERFFTEETKQKICEKMQVEEGDLLLFVADLEKIVCKVLGELRAYLANKLELIDKNKFNFVWVTDFPLFEWDEESKSWKTAHHMFTMPKEEHIQWLDNPEKYGEIIGQLYDLVCNGIELSSGSIRCHLPQVQKKIFKVIGITEEEMEKRFGFFIKALQYGTPPHGGIAPGIDRIAMLMTHADSIREVIAFPKTLKAVDLMSEAPSDVDENQLKELSIKIEKKRKGEWKTEKGGTGEWVNGRKGAGEKDSANSK